MPTQTPSRFRSGAELLAPAGGPEAGYAALQYGADAIYLGLRRFSARAEAVNFTPDEAAAIIAYAHGLTPRRRIFVTLNTLAQDVELPNLVESLALLTDLGVDAVIVQDLGLAAVARRFFPGLELHASTQMAIHNLAGARELRRLGIRRVALARELTLEEVAGITAGAGLETEVFIHGALCYCYSGLCLFSSHLYGRSGNRGRCAYPCRELFTPGAEAAMAAGMPFSMKDLALPDLVPDLVKAGVACFKLEGRMKSPLYVAAVTAFYRKLLDGGWPDPAERAQAEADLKTIFSRPWTELYSRSRRNQTVVDPQFVGHRGTPAGQAEAVVRRPGGSVLRLRLTRPLELHDGLQVEIPGASRPYGFAVDDLVLVEGNARRKAFTAPAGARVEMILPADAPEIPAAAELFCSASQDVKRRFPLSRPRETDLSGNREVNISLQIEVAELRLRAVSPPLIPGTPEVVTEAVLAGPFSAAKNPAGMQAAFTGVFDRLGDTRFRLGCFTVHNPDQLFVPVSHLNRVRRELMVKLEEACRSQVTETAARIQAVLKAENLTPAENINTPVGHRCQDKPAEAGTPNCLESRLEPVGVRWSLKTDQPGILAAFTAADRETLEEVIVEFTRLPPASRRSDREKLLAEFGPERLRVSLPVITRGWEEAELGQSLREWRDAGCRRWQIANLSGLDYLRTAGAGESCDITADWPLYVTNSQAIAQLRELGLSGATLSPEDSLENMRELLGRFSSALTLAVYQDTPLFISESCAWANLQGGCQSKEHCPSGVTELTAARGGRFLAVPGNCRTILLNQSAFCLSHRLPDLVRAGARRMRADFLYRPYTPEQAVAIWRQVRAGRPVPCTHSGNIDRGM